MRTNNPFWQIEAANTLKLEIDPNDFFSLQGYELFELVYLKLNTIHNIADSTVDSVQSLKFFTSLSYEFKTIYLLAHFYTYTFEHGNLSFLYYHGEKMDCLINGCEYFKLFDLHAPLVSIRGKVKDFDREEFSAVNEATTMDKIAWNDEVYTIHMFYHTNDPMLRVLKTMRNNPEAFFVDSFANPIQLEFTGELKKGDSENYELITLRKGIKHGSHSFYKNGVKERELIYEDGEELTKIDYYLNGNIKNSEGVINPVKKIYERKTYYESGKIQGISLLDKDGPVRSIMSTTYYENGNLKLVIKKNNLGETREWFYENGSKKSVGGMINWIEYIDQFWDENGVQTVIDGNGKFYRTWEHNNEMSAMYGSIKKSKFDDVITTEKGGIITNIEIHENGTKRYVKSIEGQLVKEEYFYNENGIFLNGIKNSYFEDGNLCERKTCAGNWDNYELDYFYENGNLKRKLVYENSDLVSDKSWREDGTEV